MVDMVTVGALSVLAALCALTIKKQVPELALVLVLVAGILILSFVLGALSDVVTFFYALADTANLSPLILAPVLKTVGIAIITKLTAELCKGATESGLAAFVEIAGSATALYIALPLLEAVLNMIMGLL